jgi:diacylglycerol kinase family enzyme
VRSSLGRVRGLLVVNPQATTTSPRTADVIVSALSAQLDLDVVPTEHRDHARELGLRAGREDLDVIVTFGGDGTVNEVVNGVMAVSTGPGPIVAPVPGGSANVFARALGLPRDPVEAAGEILASLRIGSTRRIGLGRADIVDSNGGRSQRWFTANAGVGIDAGVIEAMESQRTDGHTASPARYLRTAIRQFWTADRSEPAVTVQRGDEVVAGVFWAIVQNTSPWTYLGALPIDACPDASFDTGLDLFALRRMGLFTATRAARRLLANSRAGSTKRSITVWHDTQELAFQAQPPIAMQVDGELMGPVSAVHFVSVAHALTTVAPQG